MQTAQKPYSQPYSTLRLSVVIGCLRLALCAIIFTILSGWGLRAAADSPQQNFLEQFASRRIEFPGSDSDYAKVSSGRYPVPLRWLFQFMLSWDPLGTRPLYSAKCDPDVWGQKMQDPRLAESVLMQGGLVQKYLQECGSEVRTGDDSYWWNTLRILTMRLEPQDHPFLHRVVFHLPGSINLKGLLALKGDYKKRPFVVLRLGIFSSVEEFLPERYLLMQLFEQSPFNVLVVENMSSPDFIDDNRRFAFGGYDEGIQNILIAKMLRDPAEPLSRLVDNLHFVGVSLGGHGVLFSSLLNKFNGDGKLIQSFVGLCPVVNLQPTMIELTENGVQGRAANFWGSRRLRGLREKIPALADVNAFRFIPAVMRNLEKNYHGGLSYVQSVQLPPGMQDGDDFWQMNSYWNYYQNVESPVMIWATEEDPAVPFKLNSYLLKKRNIKVVSFEKGIHCTLPIPYHWDAIATMLQTYIISHSPGFKLNEQKMVIDITNENLRVNDGPVLFKTSWPDNKRYIKLEVEKFQLSLPVQNFDFNLLNPELGPAEQRMLARWVHQNVRVRLETNQDKRNLVVTWKTAP